MTMTSRPYLILFLNDDSRTVLFVDRSYKRVRFQRIWPGPCTDADIAREHIRYATSALDRYELQTRWGPYTGIAG